MPDDRGAFPAGTRKEVEARLAFLERLASECDDEVSAPHSGTHECSHVYALGGGPNELEGVCLGCGAPSKVKNTHAKYNACW